MAIPKALQRRRRSHRAKTILIIWLLTLGFGSLGQMMLTVSARAAEISNLMNLPSDGLENLSQAAIANAKVKSKLDSCLASAPMINVKPGLHRQIQIVNCSDQDLLGAANAAQQKFGQPVPILPEQGTWIIKKAGSLKDANVLTFDIPLTWEDTQCPPSAHGMCEGIIGPRLWARTGCRYDLGFDKAQCETGGCGGRYDCSAARVSSTVGTTVSEWTFAEPVSRGGAKPVKYLKDSPDISAVDGVNLNMDIEPVGGDLHDPFDLPPSGPTEGQMGHDIQWLQEQYPLTVHGQDVRASCPVGGFQLTRSTLANHEPYGFVYVNALGQPIDDDGTVDDGVVACFSNCGRYEFPTPPVKSCTATAGSDCYYWKSFCLGDPSQYGQACAKDSDCPVNGACWNNPGSANNNTCQGRGFVESSNCFPLADGTANPNCPYVTYQYGYVDDVTKPPTVFHSTQPPVGTCSGVSSDANACIGDDTLHKVMPKAYTWPNDPQVYGGDSPGYRVIIAPGGIEGGMPKITGLSTIPFCKDLPGAEDVYGYSTALTNCSNPIGYGALFGLAKTAAYSKSHNEPWGCDVNPLDSGDKFLICKWDSPAAVQQIGLRANFNSSGSNLNLNVLPKALLDKGDLLLASITFFSGATATPPQGWTPVPGASVVSNSSDETAVWYHFVVEPNAEPASYNWAWNGVAYPAGGITAWRGVNSTGCSSGSTKCQAFDAAPVVDQGTGANATAPSIITKTAKAQVLSIFGAGEATGLAFGLPVSNKPGIGTDETGALVVNGGPTIKSYYAHLVADRIGASSATDPGPTDPQTVTLSSSNQGDPTMSNWTAISIALRPE